MRKIAVVFPGVGYTKDRPLLYYAGKLAVKYGYELKFMDFSGLDWSKDKLKDREFLTKTLDICLDITEKTLEKAGDLSEDKVVFISKSIGTVVASAYAKRKEIKAQQICFSPLELIDDFVIEEGAILFCGDDDPYADFTSLENIAKEKKLQLHRIAGGNHSLETGDICTDIDNMKIMMNDVADAILM
ncbi:MAG: hypothetical protein IKP31_04220 [Lachnospiraceae bacterium]|nr:hypothetical protein [Lachnospiraceae bacterium]